MAKSKNLTAQFRALLKSGLTQADVLRALATEHPAIEIARKDYVTDDIEIDSGAMVSESDEGCWVSAWVHVNRSQYECDQHRDTGRDVCADCGTAL